MECSFCKNTIAKKDKYCRHCGKLIPDEMKLSTPPVYTSPRQYSEKERDSVLADCYEFLLGKDYMEMITTLHELNPGRAIKMMQSDLEVRLGGRPKKSQEEIDKELKDFFDDPVTVQSMSDKQAGSKQDD